VRVKVRSVAGTLATPGVRRSLLEILQQNDLCAVATVSPGRQAHVNTVYFAFGKDLALYFYSYPTSRHAQNLRRIGSTAVAVYDSRQSWGGSDKGLQLFGFARQATGKRATDAARIYGGRFPAFRTWVRSMEASEESFELVPYHFTPTELTVFDERRLGSGVFVHVRLPGRTPRRRAP
jgi:uncharacterized protein YhbP (UPF0306 family)